MKWLFAGFTSLGLLVGVISGLSQTPIVATLLTIIITFAGGSIIAIVRGHDPEKLKLIGKSLVFFSLATLAGVFVGLLLREYLVVLPLPPMPPIIQP